MLGAYIDAMESRRKEFVVYSSEEPELALRFAEHNVTVEHRSLPPESGEGFLVVREHGEFVGAISLEELSTLLEPPITGPAVIGSWPPVYRALFEVLEDTVFAALDRRQLLATSREIEDRAFRVGRGTLRVGFQSGAAFQPQRVVYERLASETALDIHLYGAEGWEPGERLDLTVHASEALEPYWFLAFDGGGESSQACALVAEQTDGEYTGFWTYDSEQVDEILQDVARAA